MVLFDFCNLSCLRAIECKLSDGTCQFRFSHIVNIKKFDIIKHLSRWCVSKVLQYIYNIVT